MTLKYSFQDPVGEIRINEDWSGEGNAIAGLQWPGGVVLRWERAGVRRRERLGAQEVHSLTIAMMTAVGVKKTPFVGGRVDLICFSGVRLRYPSCRSWRSGSGGKTNVQLRCQRDNAVYQLDRARARACPCVYVSTIARPRAAGTWTAGRCFRKTTSSGAR